MLLEIFFHQPQFLEKYRWYQKSSNHQKTSEMNVSGRDLNTKKVQEKILKPQKVRARPKKLTDFAHFSTHLRSDNDMHMSPCINLVTSEMLISGKPYARRSRETQGSLKATVLKF